MSGCGTRTHAQAVSAARAWAATHGLEEPVHCTTGVSVPYRVRTNDFLCTAHRTSDTCDEVRVMHSGLRWTVTVYRRDVDCVLPA